MMKISVFNGDRHVATMIVSDSPSDGWSNVDVCKPGDDDESIQMRALAWNDGSQVLFEELPPKCHLVAVDLRGPRQKKG